MSKVMTAKEALAMVEDGATVVSSGFQFITNAEELMKALETRFLETGAPRDLTIMHASGQGLIGQLDLGLTHYAHEGLIKRYITGHFANNKAMIELANQDKIEVYNLPQGVICQMYRAAAAGKSGELTKVGLKTFVDPRLEGGKVTPRTKEDIVHLVDIKGEEYLFYDAPKIDIALIRGTTADRLGNVSMEEECGVIDSQDVAMAAKANGGKVFVQVKNYVEAGSLKPKDVIIPGNLVDGIIITTDIDKYHRQTPATIYDPAMAGIYKVQTTGAAPLELNDRKVIARRAAMELRPSSTVNLGIGIPESVATVAGEEGVTDEMILTIESGFIGGVPVGGLSFGSAVNHWAMLPMATQFDFYNGGGLQVAFLGFAEISPKGDVNSSKFNKRLAGCGGFIDISQFTPKMVFCGTMTAGGLKTSIENGKLSIISEGKQKKFLKEIEQVTFSSEYAVEHNQEVLVVTERCVFRLTKDGFILSEVADGIDIERDIIGQMEFTPLVQKDIKTMNPAIFSEGLIDLRKFMLCQEA